MWICTRKHGPAPQESALPLAKASLAAFPGVAFQSAEVNQLWYLGVPGVAPRVFYAAAGGTHVLALLVAVMFAAEKQHPCTFWNVPLACAATRTHFWGCGPACFLPSFTACTACETSILAPSARKHEWKMQPAAAQRTLCRRQNAYTMDPHIWKLGC